MNKTPSKNLPREAFYTDGIKATILDHLQYLPQEFSIKFLTVYLASLAEKPFADDEIPSLTDRARRAMKTWKKAGKIEICHERTPDNNLLTHYQKK